MVYKAVCVRDYFWKRRWYRGDIYEGGEKPPSPYFEIIETEQKVFPISANPIGESKESKNPKKPKKQLKKKE